MALIREIDGRTWRTPVTAHAPQTVGTARLIKKHYSPGAYHLEGIGGFEYWRCKRPVPVVCLQQKPQGARRWAEWMVDDPTHWDGMREAVEDLPDGRIVVAGLGLGLMLHHMADRRFTAVTVVELNPDVVELIRPTLPNDDRVTIVVGDFYEYIASRRGQFDAVLWDLAVGGPRKTLAESVLGRALVGFFLGAIPLRQFGTRRRGSVPAPDLMVLADGGLHAVRSEAEV